MRNKKIKARNKKINAMFLSGIKHRVFNMALSENPLQCLSLVYEIFIGFVARYNKDGLLRGRQMSGARPIKISYTRGSIVLTRLSDDTNIAGII
jgi:transposase